MNNLNFRTILCLTLPLLAASCKRSEERIDLTKYVWVDPGEPIIDLSRGSAKLHVTVRNVHELPLSTLTLAVKSEGCSATVEPEQIDTLIPGDRKAFSVVLTAQKKAARKRYRLMMTLRAKGLPTPAGLDLLVDLRQPSDQRWIDVGQVKLVRASPARKTSYYLLASVPLLLMLGWGVWRIIRKRKQ